jgi:gamma-glutamylcysteine synthetase
MQVISEKEAHAKWLEKNMDDVFEFEDYVKHLLRTGVMVIRSGQIRTIPSGKIDEKLWL